MSQYIDFNYVKEHADIKAILAYYNLDTSGSGAERRCCCPFHEDEHPSFSINIEDGKFNCHAASCGEKGNILDFVAAMEDTDDLRTASEVISEICSIDLAPPRSTKAKHSAKRKAKRGSVDAKREPTRAADKAEPTKTTTGKGKLEAEAKPNSPLSFQLTLDPQHAYGKARKLSQNDNELYEMGYCSRGTMKGRWCIPYHNASGDVIGYIGRYAADPVPDGEIKYKLPKGFNKNQELFNLHRVAGHSKHAVIVEGAFDTIRLHRLAMPSVALIGTSISDVQIEKLVRSGFKSVTVMLDNDAADQKTRDTIENAGKGMVYRLSRRLLVRSVELPEGEDPATVDEEFLRGCIPRFPS